MSKATELLCGIGWGLFIGLFWIAGVLWKGL
ncbi:hypothetical protein BRW83_1972 [Oxalobacter formigenes]|nr:hypothetical protein BRW83_1972 [Oxalobacter formigenes]